MGEDITDRLDRLADHLHTLDAQTLRDAVGVIEELRTENERLKEVRDRMARELRFMADEILRLRSEYEKVELRNQPK